MCEGQFHYVYLKKKGGEMKKCKQWDNVYKKLDTENEIYPLCIPGCGLFIGHLHDMCGSLWN